MDTQSAHKATPPPNLALTHIRRTAQAFPLQGAAIDCVVTCSYLMRQEARG